MVDQSPGSRMRQGAEPAAVTVDVAGAQMGGAARFKAELLRYLERTRRDDVRIIGTSRRVDPAWLLRREMARPCRGRYVALNNVSFMRSGTERWTLLRNALHFLTDDEASSIGPSLRAATRRETAVVRFTARRSDVLVVPSTAMADRVVRLLPGVRSRVVVRPHPVSADAVPQRSRDLSILCPVLFAPYKQMTQRLTELLAAVRDFGDSSVRVRVTADRPDLAGPIPCDSAVEFVGRLDQQDLRQLWARSRAVYFPTGLESFGYPLAEARVSGRPVIARDTAQNREIAGPALCGFDLGDPESLRRAVALAMTRNVAPDPAPFDPDAYFDWILGCPR
jgi:glycosyltransferase involved in cell wall biosynthesis